MIEGNDIWEDIYDSPYLDIACVLDIVWYVWVLKQHVVTHKYVI